jgi:hypothetical protein
MRVVGEGGGERRETEKACGLRVLSETGSVPAISHGYR